MLRATTLVVALTAALVAAAPPLQAKGHHKSGHDYRASYTVVEKVEQTFPLESAGRLSLQNINGDVHITTWDRREVSVEGTKRATSQERLDELEVHMDAQDDHVRIRTEFEDGDKWRHHDDHYEGALVDFEIKVPRAMRLDEVALVNGDLEIDGLSGRVHASCVNGALRATELSGDVDLSTVNGTLELTLQRLDASASVRLQTVNGTVDVVIPKKVGARVRATTVNGSIVDDLGDSGLTASKHDVVGASLRGTVGDGGATIDVNAVNGTIRIRGEDAER